MNQFEIFEKSKQTVIFSPFINFIIFTKNMYFFMIFLHKAGGRLDDCTKYHFFFSKT